VSRLEDYGCFGRITAGQVGLLDSTLKLGADTMLRNPFRAVVLIDAVERLLNDPGHQASAQYRRSI
jgi:FixJ family two-component response regulator